MKTFATNSAMISSSLPRFLQAIVVLLSMATPAAMNAGSIFDDNWTPPKAVSRPSENPSTNPTQHTSPTPTTAPAPAPPVSTPAKVAMPPIPPPSSILSPTGRLAIPDKSSLARSRHFLKKSLPPDSRTVQFPPEPNSQALIEKAAEPDDTPADRFALLSAAIEASKEASSMRLCSNAAEAMAKAFDVDGLSIEIDAAVRMNLRANSQTETAENIAAGLELVDSLVAVEDVSDAARISILLRTPAAGDPALRLLVQKRIQNVEQLRVARERVSGYVERLKTSPNDPSVSLEVGSYYCFKAGKWDKGLPLLAKCSDSRLRELAVRELSPPTKNEDLIRLADGWWEVAGTQKGLAHSTIILHAAYFYKAALADAAGLEREVIQRRISESEKDRATAVSTKPAPPKEGLIALWAFDEVAGSIAGPTGSLFGKIGGWRPCGGQVR